MQGVRFHVYTRVEILLENVSNVLNTAFCFSLYRPFLLLRCKPEAAIFVTSKMAAAIIAKRKQIHSLHCGRWSRDIERNSHLPRVQWKTHCCII